MFSASPHPAAPLPASRRVAVVGAGPAGLFALQALAGSGQVPAVDVFDLLPAPYGLVRYGVAPDHVKTKSVIRVFERELQRPGVRFFGNVRFGVDLHRADLRRHYDAVVYATGARDDRELGLPGEHLPGSHGGAEFVSWYSGHPDAADRRFVLATDAAVVIGAGNVALDLVRILAKAGRDLEGTDMPPEVLAALGSSTITDLHLLARRAPEYAKFSPVELRELGGLADVQVVVDPADLPADDEAAAAAGRDAGHNLRTLRAWAAEPGPPRPRRIHLHFGAAPRRILGERRVTGIAVRRTGRDGGVTEQVLPAGLVLRAIGYRAQELPGLPFDHDRAVIPNLGGRILDAGVPQPGEYVAGWLKRGPSGVIGTNRADAVETVGSLLADLPVLPAGQGDTSAIPRLLRDRGVEVVTWEGWKRLEAREAAGGEARGCAAVKVNDWDALLAASRGGADEPARIAAR